MLLTAKRRRQWVWTCSSAHSKGFLILWSMPFDSPLRRVWFQNFSNHWLELRLCCGEWASREKSWLVIRRSGKGLVISRARIPATSSRDANMRNCVGLPRLCKFGQTGSWRWGLFLAPRLHPLLLKHFPFQARTGLVFWSFKKNPKEIKTKSKKVFLS